VKDDIAILVNHVVYPMTTRDVRDNPVRMSKQVEYCEGRIKNFFLNPEVKHTAMQDEFLAAMNAALKRILVEAQQSPITRVNAARVASRLAALTGREEIADLLVTIVTDPKQVEGAKFYGLQGLKELMSRLGQKQTPPIKDAKRRGDVLTALVAFVERQPPYTPNTEDEVEGLRVIRREAIRALAEVREAKLANTPNGHAALALARVLGKDKTIAPEPRLDEQLEAAIGLTRIPPDAAKEYQPGYAAFLIARYVSDFVRKYQDVKIREPWKFYAARLKDGLTAMEAAFQGDAAVKAVFGFCNGPLNDVEKSKTPSLVDSKPIIGWLESNPAVPPTIYKSDANSAVTPRAPAPVKGM
jgi:hypothetical protein